jgi:predicted TIM-barrel fold metal-dependent hydrolase
MTSGAFAIDTWVNPNTPDCARVWYEQQFPAQVRTEVFQSSTDLIGQGCSIEETITDMRSAGIDRGVLSGMYTYSPWPDVRDFFRFLADTCREHPDVFIASGGVDPRTGYEGVKTLEWMVRELDFRAFRVMPTLVGLPPNDAIYYPFYVKCIELDIPVTCNVGFPGPRMDVTLQHPLHLDRVLRDFPELKVIGTHVGSPWQLEVIAMLVKYPNFFLMTSAFAPKHYPREYLDFMNTRGAHKIMFATDYPLLPFDRCMNEARELPLKPDVMQRFLRDNALELFRWN